MPPAKTKPAVTLADLSPEDRKALLEEAREASKRNPTDVAGYDELTDREKAIRELLDARDHARGCPVVDGEVLGRIEADEARRPPDPVSGAPAVVVAVARCAECGGSTVHDERLEPLIEEASAILAEQAAGDEDDTLT